MDPYMAAVQAAESASRAIAWTRPVRFFGYVVIVMAVLLAAIGLIVGVTLAFSPSDGRQEIFAAIVLLSSLVIAAVNFLFGSAVLMISYYVKMRSEDVVAKVDLLLAEED